MRRVLVTLGLVAALSPMGAGLALAGGQEDPGPGEGDTIADTVAPEDTTPDDTGVPVTTEGGAGTPTPPTAPRGTTLPTLPPECDVPPPPTTIFVGRLTAAAGGVGRFHVDAVRLDPDGLVAIGGLVDVRLGDDLRFLTLDGAYLVAADADGRGGLQSKVRQPLPLFGGDQVVGINDGDVDCPDLVDPIVVRNADGGSVDTGVFGGFLDDKRGIGLSFLKPAAAVLGVLVGLVVLKYVLIGIGRAVRFSVRWARRRVGRGRRRAPVATTGS